MILRIGIFAVAALAVAGGVVMFGGSGFGAGPSVPVASVELGAFVRTIEAEGNLEAAEATKLTAPMNLTRPARISWLAEDGRHVEEGQVVVRFDPTEMTKELETGRIDRRTAESKLRKTDYESESKLTGIELDAEAADKELEYASEFQSKDAVVFSRVEIIESEIDQTLAIHRKENADKSRAIHNKLSKADRDLLEIEKRKADLAIEQAQTNLSQLEIKAPHAGIFVLQEHWGERPEIGSVMWRGSPVAEIPQMDKMNAKVFVLEADAGGIEEGLEVQLSLESDPRAVYSGKISSVDALPTRRVRWSPVQYFPVMVELDTTNPDVMKPGQRVRAVLKLDARDDALSVPREAIFELEGKKVVYRYRGGDFDPIEVELGPAALGRVVVESGLEKGDRVALRDPTSRLEEAGDADGATASAGPLG
ncbi:hypothetical protein ABI59_11150 [Acidobacteria bacterium Mor1]|nr:hypothetical protein ABI59_11150 [Acidobacteria bacterium Mor1]